MTRNVNAVIFSSQQLISQEAKKELLQPHHQASPDQHQLYGLASKEGIFVEVENLSVDQEGDAMLSWMGDVNKLELSRHQIARDVREGHQM